MLQKVNKQRNIKKIKINYNLKCSTNRVPLKSQVQKGYKPTQSNIQ